LNQLLNELNNVYGIDSVHTE